MKFKVYSKSGCSFCQESKKVLREYNLNFEVIDTPESRKWVKLNYNTYPQIFIEGEEGDVHIGGFRELENYLMENILS